MYDLNGNLLGNPGDGSLPIAFKNLLSGNRTRYDRLGRKRADLLRCALFGAATPQSLPRRKSRVPPRAKAGDRRHGSHTPWSQASSPSSGASGLLKPREPISFLLPRQD